jgi:hypothetical protein
MTRKIPGRVRTRLSTLRIFRTVLNEIGLCHGKCAAPVATITRKNAAAA